MRDSPIPLAEIETLFLDAGNTLISMDFAWIERELLARGLSIERDALIRAEAAARPAVSFRHAQPPLPVGLESFEFYLDEMLDRVAGAAVPARHERAELVRDVAAALKKPGEDYRLWSRVLPGVPEALARLEALGLELVVVSNSDGSVARALAELGLIEHLTAVLDSAVVGYEKPDPRFFEHALGVAGAPRERTLHVGDMYHQDVLGARAAGIDVVLLDPFDDWHVDDCLRLRDLAELAEQLAAART